jgi:hypothetical protein
MCLTRYGTLFHGRMPIGPAPLRLSARAASDVRSVAVAQEQVPAVRYQARPGRKLLGRTRGTRTAWADLVAASRTSSRLPALSNAVRQLQTGSPARAEAVAGLERPLMARLAALRTGYAVSVTMGRPLPRAHTGTGPELEVW